jgi:hypothetical protein
MAKFPQLFVALEMLLGVGHATADIRFDYDTTIDYTIERHADDGDQGIQILRGTNPEPPTIVNVVEPALIHRDIDVYDSSRLNVYSGRIAATDEGVTAHDTSIVNIHGGEISSASAGGTSLVNVFGGEFKSQDGIQAFGHGTVNVYDGLFHGRVDAEGWGTVNIFDGTFEAGVAATDQEGQMHIFGGSISRLEVEEWCQMTVYGTSFNYPHGPIHDNAGMLTGVLASGQPISAEFNIDKTYSEDVSIVLAVPEPSTLVLATTSAVGMLAFLRRRRRRW